MATVTNLTTTGAREATATITGTGFGSTQGASVVLFYPDEDGEIMYIAPSSWSASSITTTVPATAKVGAQGFFVVQIDGGPGDRTTSFPVKAKGRGIQYTVAQGTIIMAPKYILVQQL